MTILQASPQIRLDSLVLATYATGLENVGGLDVVSGRRSSMQRLAYQPGAVEQWGDFPEPKLRTFRVWLTPYDVDGNVTYANGPLAHLRENIDTLNAVLAKRRTPITVELDVTQPTGAVETRQGLAKAVFPTRIEGTRKRLANIGLMFPFPYWNVLPQLSTGALTGAGNNVVVGGGAPAHDLTFTFSNDARITHTQTGDWIEVTGSGGTPVVVNLRARTITQSGSPARNLVRRSSPWFMYWEPGTVTLDITGAGTVTVDYYEARE